MTKIRFRAWNESAKRYSKPFTLKCSVLNFTDDDGLGVMKSLTDEVVEQFTGLTDKNGVEIYEGDIMSPIHYQKVEFGNAVVEFKKGMFCFAVNKPFISTTKPITESFGHGAKANNHFVVIGNIHENPELLCAKK